MLISELFERDPKRPIEPVVKVTQHDPEVVFTELDEYVVTDEIHRYMSDLIDRFAESRIGLPPSVCAWISGFFGSGKSHFLKVLGYVLADRPIRLPSEQERGAANYFCQKYSLPHGLTLERELQTKAIFVNMLDFDREKGPDITRIIYRALLTDLGLSDVFWVAEVERMLQARGLWNDFLAFVQETDKQPWTEARRMSARARSILARGLHELDAAAYPTLELAEKSIDDARADFSLDPGRLAERLVEEAEAIHPTQGRLGILLDEVGLYIGTHTDRVTELNALSERITELGKGKVWLIVTAQEALEQIIPKVEAKAGQFQWLQDRFQIKVRLTPDNIDTVVKKRLLQKKADPAKLNPLRKLYTAHAGSLATSAMIKDPARDYQALFTRLDQGQFVTSYPLLPYHVRLMQEIFGVLRSRGGASQELTGRERAVLGVVRATLVGLREREGLADRPLGELATFDMVYDAIDEELKAVRSAQQSVIAHDIAQLGQRDGLRVDAVAKALFLLQQVGEWIPCTPENIAAVLYPCLGAEGRELEKAVRECLAALREGVWVAEEDGKYRFLSEVERTFEQDVARQTANEEEKRALGLETIKAVLKDLKLYNHLKIRSFNVYLTADDAEVTTKGHLKLAVYSPLGAAHDSQLLPTLMATSLANRNTVYWVAKADDRVEDALERVICVSKALRDHEAKAQSEDEQRALDKHRRAMEILRDDDLPRLLVNALTAGTIIYQGEEAALDGRRTVREIANEQLRELAEDLFTEFSHAAFAVERDEHIGRILTWQGEPLPGIYRDLQLVDDLGNVLIDRPVASRILAEVNRRHQDHVDLTGGALADHFDTPPYGWEPRIVRLALATLFRNGSVTVTHAGKEYVSATESGSHEAFTNARAFAKARFAPGEEVTPEQRDQAAQLVSEIFGEYAGLTVEEVDAALCRSIQARLEPCQRLRTVAVTIGLPVASGLADLTRVMGEVAEAPTRSRRILGFLDEKRLAVLKGQVPMLKKLRGFEAKGLLDTYRAVRRFASEIAPQLVATGHDGEVTTGLDAITQNLGAADFLDRWPDVIAGYEDLRGRYATVYHNQHTRRGKLVQEALSSLQTHPALEGLSSQEADALLRPLLDLACDVSAPQVAEASDFVCQGCRAWLKDLAHHCEVVEARRRAIRQKLDEMLVEGGEEGEEVIVGFATEETIMSAQEMAALTGRMAKVTERALAAGKQVTASVEIEII